MKVAERGMNNLEEESWVMYTAQNIVITDGLQLHNHIYIQL